jgi:hypothetical protein
MSIEDRTDLLLLALAIASILAFIRVTADLCRPVPLRRRAVAQVRSVLGW